MHNVLKYASALALVLASASAFVRPSRNDLWSREPRPLVNRSTSRYVSTLDTGNNNNERPSKSNVELLDQDVTLKRRQDVTVSRALPFLSSPVPLLETAELAGNFGFDPLQLSQSKDDVYAYREAEMKHGRLAMLAAVGWPVSELLDRRIADAWGLPAVLDETDRVPSILNGGLDSVSPVWWGACLGLTAAIDLHGVTRSRSGDPDYFPGNLGFDPLNLYPRDKAGQARMQLAEIKHGRTAMIGVTGFAFQEYATQIGVVDQTPLFFYPVGGLL